LIDQDLLLILPEAEELNFFLKISCILPTSINKYTCARYLLLTKVYKRSITCALVTVTHLVERFMMPKILSRRALSEKPEGFSVALI
jgi:hypothetical protein